MEIVFICSDMGKKKIDFKMPLGSFLLHLAIVFVCLLFNINPKMLGRWDDREKKNSFS